MIHLSSVTLKEQEAALPEVFPFTLPIVQDFSPVEFKTEVTFLVGENGSGKSTFLEALGCAIGSITVGSESVEKDATLSEVRAFAKHLRLVWKAKTRRGFFMRAEDFFGFAKSIAQKRQELLSDLRDAERKFKDRSPTALQYGRAAYAKELGELERSYGDGLDARSHGECFLDLFKTRFVPGGLYLLDEPEVPLSPLRQLTLISILKEMIEQDAQFVIATHSPILMAFPGAVILSFDGHGIQPVEYVQLEHVTITRTFLNSPDSFLRHL